jgi:peptidoglycan/xylan/chitin deacetylase (PgdA/CDA1 family)
MPVVHSVETDRHVVALTFDDGPLHPETERLLDVLDETDAHATFFVRGGAIDDETKGLVVRAARAGHEIGNHTHSHLNLEEADHETVTEEILRTHHQLAELTGLEPTVIRPPYGRGTEIVDEIASAVGYRATVNWSVDPEDWASPPAAKIAERVLAGLASGAIVLMHDGCTDTRAGQSRMGTVEAVHTLIPIIRERGFELVTVSQLLESM